VPTWDAETAECLIFTYKEGLLSRAAHDLKIGVTRFDLSVDKGEVTASFDARSLRTITAMKRGRENPSALSRTDRETIDERIRHAVLHSDRYPRIVFSGRGVPEPAQAWTTTGRLTLHGKDRPLTATIRTEGELWIARLQIDQNAFGITPFKAMMGTLRIKPRVDVIVRCTLSP
jgi:hypothetical protein